TIFANAGGWGPIVRNGAGATYYPDGVNTLTTVRTGVSPSTSFIDITPEKLIPVEAGKNCLWSVYANPSRCEQEVIIAWQDDAGGNKGYSFGAVKLDRHGVSLPGNALGVNWVRLV